MLYNGTTPTREAHQVIEDFAKHMYERGAADKLIGSKATAAVVLGKLAVEALDKLTLEFSEFGVLLLQDPYPVEAFFEYGRDRFETFLGLTEEAYQIVLSSAQEDLVES